MARRGPRGLSPEERELWRRVAETATPLHAGRPAKPTLPAERPKGQRHAQPPATRFQIGQAAPKQRHKTDTAAEFAGPAAVPEPAGMDRRIASRLKRGKLVPEARVDLHGMTLAEAQPVLTGFIQSSHRAGHRLVLVITGKGRGAPDDGPIPIRRGVLRHQVPHWLASPPLAPLVLRVTQAHHRHGGAGACYVFLRRRR